MRHGSLLVVFYAACQYTPPPEQDPPGTVVLVLDTADELAGTALNLATHDRTFTAGAFGVAGPGTVEPIAYAVGGLHARGINARLFGSAAEGTWEQLASASIAGQNFMSPGAFALSGSQVPFGLGFTDSTDYCIFFDGEIFLESGEHAFQIQVDHDAFLEIAQPGTTDFSRAVEARFDGAGNPPDEGSYDTSVSDWHPIRLAMCQDGGDARLVVNHEPPGRSSALLETRRLRAPLHQLTGDLRTGFGEPDLTVPNDATTIGSTPFNVMWTSSTEPAGFARSVRLAGQVRLLAPASTRFTVAATIEHRLWLDGELVSSPTSWQTGTQQPTSTDVTLELAAGWHDLAIDVSSAADGTGAIAVSMGLDGAAPTPIALDQTRPISMAQRIVTQSATGSTGTSNIPLPVQVGVIGDPAAIVRDVDVMWRGSFDNWQNLIAELEPPTGSPIILFDDANTNRNGGNTIFKWVTAADDLAVTGTWTVRFRPRTNTLQVTNPAISLTHHVVGGSTGYPPLATYVSPILALDAPATPFEVTAVTIEPDGTGVALSVRTCSDDAAANCSDWVAAADLDSAEPGAFVQLRAELSATGTTAPILDGLTVKLR